jgi:hypothetical protein
MHSARARAYLIDCSKEATTGIEHFGVAQSVVGVQCSNAIRSTNRCCDLFCKRLLLAIAFRFDL